MKHLIIGAASIIGSFLVETLLIQVRTVIGIDNINAYYDTRLKKKRLSKFEGDEKFKFILGDFQ